MDGKCFPRGVAGIGLLALLGGMGAAPDRADGEAIARRPNVVMIMTDDQGYGDLGFHGNPVIQTPNLDRLARQSVRLDRFYVMPVCSPTRACLLTGRYNYRTRVVDTFQGRSMMDPEEVTLAEMLATAGYRTAIFGKWHLGDNYPLRAIDQGFQEALVLKGGGIGQPSDPPGGSSYFDPVLQHNGKEVKRQGYCSDVFTDAAIAYIEANRDRPFFVYLAFNCPHNPLQVPDSYLKPYQDKHLTNDQFPDAGHPLPAPLDPDVTARVYGMVTNIDDNLGRLFATLDDRGLARDTIVVFLTDNGPQQVRYVAGMLDRKGSVHEGGIRVPCFIRWPAALPADRVVDRIAAHIDLTPTILDACGVTPPAGASFDGRSLLPLLKGEATEWPDRTLFFQWHRGDIPERYRAFAARSQHYKLVRPERVPNSREPHEPKFELYDMESDPLERHDIAGAHADIVDRLRASYDRWFDEVGSTRGYEPPRIVLGAPQENPSVLTRQDLRDDGGGAPEHPRTLGNPGRPPRRVRDHAPPRPPPLRRVRAPGPPRRLAREGARTTGQRMHLRAGTAHPRSGPARSLARPRRRQGRGPLGGREAAGLSCVRPARPPTWLFRKGSTNGASANVGAAAPLGSVRLGAGVGMSQQEVEQSARRVGLTLTYDREAQGWRAGMVTLYYVVEDLDQVAATQSAEVIVGLGADSGPWGSPFTIDFNLERFSVGWP